MARIPAFASSTSHAPGRVPIVADIQTNVNTGQAGVALGQGIAQLGNAGERFSLAMRHANEVKLAADTELAFMEADMNAMEAAGAGDPLRADEIYRSSMEDFSESLNQFSGSEFGSRLSKSYALRMKKGEFAAKRSAAGRLVGNIKDSFTSVGEALKQKVQTDGDLDGAIGVLETQAEIASGVIGREDAAGKSGRIARELIDVKYNDLLENDPAAATELLESDAANKYLPADEITAKRNKAKEREKDFKRESGRMAFDGVSKSVARLMTGDPTSITKTNVGDLVNPTVGELSEMMGVDKDEVRTRLLSGWLDVAVIKEEMDMFDAIASNIPASHDVEVKRERLANAVLDGKKRDNSAEQMLRIFTGSKELMPRDPAVANQAYRKLRDDGFGDSYLAGLFTKNGVDLPSDLMRSVENYVSGDNPNLGEWVKTVQNVHDVNRNFGENLSRKFGDLGRVAWDVTRGVDDDIAEKRLEALQHPNAKSAIRMARESFDLARMEAKGEGKHHTKIPDIVRSALGVQEHTLVDAGATKTAMSHFMYGVAEAMGQGNVADFGIASTKGRSVASDALKKQFTVIEATDPLRGEVFQYIVESTPAGIPPESQISERQRKDFSLRINTAASETGLSPRADLAFKLDGERYIPMLRAGSPAQYMVWNERSGTDRLVSSGNELSRANKSFDQMGYTLSDVHPFRDLLWQKDYGDVSAEQYDKNTAMRIIDIARARWRDGHDNTDPKPDDKQFLLLVDSVGRALKWNKVFSDNVNTPAKPNNQ